MQRMRDSRKGSAIPMVATISIVLIAIVAVAFAGASMGFWQLSASSTATPSYGPPAGAPTSCVGVSKINLLHNDINKYAKATDPGLNVTVFSPYLVVVADDATSTPVAAVSTHKALVGDSSGTPSSTYFVEEAAIQTACVDQPFQPEIAQAGAPTCTITNSDGMTVNSDTNHEDADASTEYTFTMKCKAPTNKCSWKHGVAFMLSYDRSYVQSVDSTLPTTLSVNGFSAVNDHVFSSATNNTADAAATFFADGELCNNQMSQDYTFTVKTSSTTPYEDQPNVVIDVLPLQKDLDSENLNEVITGLYDNDRNAIFLANTTKEYFIA